MIDRQEIMEFARQFGLAANVVEKDYTLGWLLAGINHHPDLRDTWTFKGGTCLKKCYFETYRFSEDLDFTVTEPDHINEQFLTGVFNQIADWVYDNTGIEVPKDQLRFEIFTNPRGIPSCQGRVAYRGPLQNRGDLPRIKLDLTNDELLVLNPVVRDVHHPYSDKPANGMQINSYCFEEVFAEKIRALVEILRPRDLYDVIHLYRHDGLKPNQPIILDTLREKCDFKGIEVPTMQILMDHPARTELEVEWSNMLGHQLPALPAFAQFWDELPTVFDWLYGVEQKPPMPAIRVYAGKGEEVDNTWQPPSMASSWSSYGSTPLEKIRFAAANRLCIDLDYMDEKGRRSTRVIEPYRLRRTQERKLLLDAIKHETGEERPYRVDRIQSAEITQIVFEPKYLIELTPGEPISAPPTTRTASYLSRPGAGKPRMTRPRSSGLARTYGPKYIYKCTVCGKRFTKRTMNGALNPHKNKSKRPCFGRTGIYVQTKYN